MIADSVSKKPSLRERQSTFRGREMLRLPSFVRALNGESAFAMITRRRVYS